MLGLGQEHLLGLTTLLTMLVEEFFSGFPSAWRQKAELINDRDRLLQLRFGNPAS